MKKNETGNQFLKTKNCGIIMPISEHPEYPLGHWKEVLQIIVEALNETQFTPRLVSEDVAIGLLHERIVNNIYSDDIVICDVSSKNPNVMFELGMRLAFDKPTIIIKDEKTGYSFDTGVIEHISYPSTLRFNQIVEFKSELLKRIEATYDKAQAEPNYSPFLKSFGKTIVPAKIHQTEISESKFILAKLESLSSEIRSLRSYQFENARGIMQNQSEKQVTINQYVSAFLDLHPDVDEGSGDLTALLQNNLRSMYGMKVYPAEITTAIHTHRAKREKFTTVFSA